MYMYIYSLSFALIFFCIANLNVLLMLHRKCINFHQLRVKRNALIRTFLRVHFNQTAKIKLLSQIAIDSLLFCLRNIHKNVIRKRQG